MKSKYDVFISYRRDGGFDTALYLSHILRERGYRVFFDVEELRSGPFNTKLYDVIENCTDFIAVLSPQCFDRCSDKNDWFRLEMAHALKHKKNVIPFMKRGFTFNDIPELPLEINDILNMNGITASHEHTDATIHRLMEFLYSSPGPMRQTSPGLRKGIWLMVLCVLMGIIGAIYISFLRESASNVFDGTTTFTTSAERDSQESPSPPASKSKEIVSSSAKSDEFVKKSVLDQEPGDIVRALYALHEKRFTHRDALTPVRSTDEDFVYSYFTKELGSRLISQERIYSVHQDISQIVLDFDPLYNGQDVSIEEFHVAPSTITEKNARVDVHFKNFKTPTKLVYRLVSTAKGWRIDDIEYPDSQKSLRALLRYDLSVTPEQSSHQVRDTENIISKSASSLATGQRDRKNSRDAKANAGQDASSEQDMQQLDSEADSGDKIESQKVAEAKDLLQNLFNTHTTALASQQESPVFSSDIEIVGQYFTDSLASSLCELNSYFWDTPLRLSAISQKSLSAPEIVLSGVALFPMWKAKLHKRQQALQEELDAMKRDEITDFLLCTNRTFSEESVATVRMSLNEPGGYAGGFTVICSVTVNNLEVPPTIVHLSGSTGHLLIEDIQYQKPFRTTMQQSLLMHVQELLGKIKPIVNEIKEIAEEIAEMEAERDEAIKQSKPKYS